MTKIKNTKKGMAKKTLSMSLVVAMLATSNVPVWAAEFSDGSDVAVATEAPAAETTTEFSDNVAETPVVDNTEDTASASIKVNEADIYVGKNNIQNNYITHKLARKEDLWFHVKDYHGSHVLLKCEEVNED